MMNGTPVARFPESESLDLLGGRLEVVASIEAPAGDVVLFRTRMEPGSQVPLHSHSDPECFYILSGSIDAFTDNHKPGWRTLVAGRSVTMENGIRHAVRAGNQGAELLVATNHRLAAFFREAQRPTDPSGGRVRSSSEDVERVASAAAKYGYWLATPTESAAITGMV